MSNDQPSLTHQQQQQAVERIQALMAEGMSSGEAIRLVSEEIRADHKGERVSVLWDDDEERQEGPAEPTGERAFWSDDEQDDYQDEDESDELGDERDEFDEENDDFQGERDNFQEDPRDAE